MKCPLESDSETLRQRNGGILLDNANDSDPSSLDEGSLPLGINSGRTLISCVSGSFKEYSFI